jgi:hypothetical protein
MQQKPEIAREMEKIGEKKYLKWLLILCREKKEREWNIKDFESR